MHSTGERKMKHFDIRVYEKAEHWYFDTTIDAKDECDAWKVAKKDYPRREYRIVELRKIFR
jgi:hypothetical protein